MNSGIRTSVTSAAVILFLALGISGLAPAATPYGKWRLRQMIEKGKKVPLVAGSMISLRLQRSDRCSGNAGVNNYSGKCRISERNGRIRFPGGFATTLILGPADLMEQEGRYLQNLDKSKRFVMRKKKKLRLISRDAKTKLVYSR